MKKLTLVAVFLVGALVAVAQQKYAFLVGINKYFDSPGVQNPHQLQGCVNDVYAMKAMLESRFGFLPANVTTLSDEDATKKNVVNGLLELAKKCKEGDAVVFFFSGHGVWMGNDYRLAVSDSIKQGMSQAMVMSDLYSKKMGCLLTDAVLKKLVNKFVDKRVVVTTFFDCCFSGNLPMLQSLYGHNVYNYEQPNPVEKSIDVVDIFNIKAIDEIPNTPDFERSLNNELNNLPEHGNTEGLKAFDISAPIKITDKQRIARPSEREQSMFLSLSATNDREKGQDIETETGSHQGAFTYALLKAVGNHPSDVPFDTIRADIVKIMADQFYPQTPTFHYDPQRLKSNLIGIASNGFKNNVVVPCANVRQQQVTFNKGTLAGIKKGNVLQGGSDESKVAIKITFATEDSAVGEVFNGNASLLKPGENFEMTDSYTASPPLVKIYIAGSNFTATTFSNFFNKQIMPLVNDTNYVDFKNYDNTKYIQPHFFKNVSSVVKKAGFGLSSHFVNPYFIFLPIPNYIIDPLKNALSKNQNVQLLNAAEKADFALYLNYVKGDKDVKPGFVLTYQRPGDFSRQDGFRFMANSLDIPNLNLLPADLTILTNNLDQMTISMVRNLTQQWINDYRKR